MANQQEKQQLGKRRMLQQPHPPLSCPRCTSDNTKFCYYNNYNTGQPRYLCRTCNRFWTHGGKLCDIPEGSAKRNRKAPSSSSSRPSSVPSPVVNSASARSGMDIQAPIMPNVPADDPTVDAPGGISSLFNSNITDGDVNWLNVMLFPPTSFYPWEYSYGMTEQFLQTPQLFNPYENAVLYQQENILKQQQMNAPDAFFASPADAPDAFFAAAAASASDAKGKSKIGEVFGSAPSSSQI